jgi:hypothetical protein
MYSLIVFIQSSKSKVFGKIKVYDDEQIGIESDENGESGENENENANEHALDDLPVT